VATPDAGPVYKYGGSPDDELVFACDFGNQPEVTSATETLSSGTVAVSGADAALTMGAVSVSGTKLLSKGTGGTSGVTYLLTWRGIYTSGNQRVLTTALACQ
jgi:hypothetical protein